MIAPLEDWTPEDRQRAEVLRHRALICAEVRQAMEWGLPLEAACLERGVCQADVERWLRGED
jgi:hypothetical protein